MSIQYLIPQKKPDLNQAVMAPRLVSLDGATIGLLSNYKTNADKLLALIGEELQARFNLGGLVKTHKNNASANCPPEVLDMLVNRCDAVIMGLGD